MLIPSLLLLLVLQKIDLLQFFFLFPIGRLAIQGAAFDCHLDLFLVGFDCGAGHLDALAAMGAEFAFQGGGVGAAC